MPEGLTQRAGRQVRVMFGSSTTHNVTRPSHAAELLLNGWPEQDGPAYRKAKEAVLEAMEDPESDSLMIASRLAFEEAAREAGILVSLPTGDRYTRR